MRSKPLASPCSFYDHPVCISCTQTTTLTQFLFFIPGPPHSWTQWRCSRPSTQCRWASSAGRSVSTASAEKKSVGISCTRFSNWQFGFRPGPGRTALLLLRRAAKRIKKTGCPRLWPVAENREGEGSASASARRKVLMMAAVPGRARGNKAVAFHNPQALSNVEEEILSCARDQVVAARPPVLTPPMALSALSCE
jgi:hypothetical protein